MALAYDCVVVGSGHAGSCAALSAIDSGCKRVLMIDKCPESWVGGNGYFTAGAHRTVHSGLHDLLPLVRNVSKERAKDIDIEPYTRDDFISDITRLGHGRADPALVAALVDNSRDSIDWLAKRVGVPFTLSFNRQAYEVDGRQKFWGGMVLSVENGGKGLIEAHQAALREAGVEIWFDASLQQLDVRDGILVGLTVLRKGESINIRSKSAILAAGGFEANREMRSRHLGAGWERARVRGTPFNTGECFHLAAAVGAKLTGDWEGCHSTAWDANAAENAGQRDLTNQFTKSGYPLGIMVNSEGKRFVDEGEDFRNYTYAKFGRAILEQQAAIAFQIWDAKVTNSLRIEEYGDGVTEKIVANDIEVLVDKMGEKGLNNKGQLLETIRSFNNGVRRFTAEHPDAKWNPSIKDGKTTQSLDAKLDIPKSNWALEINEPPFLAVKVTCGITFTFGGLSISPESAGVISTSGAAECISGLFCAGEMVGGLFYHNYPGGSGLTAGAVFGRMAGRSAGNASQK